MRWSKVILAVQAIVVLVLAVALLKISLNSVAEEPTSVAKEDLQLFGTNKLQSVTTKFYKSSYILLLTGLLELIIIWRLLK